MSDRHLELARRVVHGRVVRRFVTREGRVRCQVAWEGATNGERRWAGGAWNTTSYVLADALMAVPVPEVAGAL